MQKQQKKSTRSLTGELLYIIYLYILKGVVVTPGAYIFLKIISVIPVFMAAAEELLSTSNLAPKELLAKALAKSAVGSY